MSTTKRIVRKATLATSPDPSPAKQVIKRVTKEPQPKAGAKRVITRVKAGDIQEETVTRTIKKKVGTEGKRLIKEIKTEEGEDYKRLELQEHILCISDSYVGSDQQTKRQTWLYDTENHTPIIDSITFPQGCERIFLEILSNAGDNALRSMAEKTDPGTIEVTMDSHWVTVRNTGKPIPIRFSKKEKLWNPSLIFGVLLTSSNYDTTKERIGCGRNGYGAKLTNIYSKHFTVECGDPINHRHFYQEWSNNMLDATEPKITEGYKGKAFVEIRYLMDFERFGYDPEPGYPEEAFSLFARYTYDYSQNIRTPTSFNGILFEPAKDPKDHARFYFGDVPMLIHYEWPAGTEIVTKRSGLQVAKDPMVLPTSMLILADTPKQGKIVSYANGMMTMEGGVHVNEALKAVSKPLLDKINEGRTKVKVKAGAATKAVAGAKTKLNWKDVKNHVSMLLVCHLKDPQFGGQMKERLTKPVPKFKIDPKTLDPVNKWNLSMYLLADLEDKLTGLLAVGNGKRQKHINIAKAKDANWAKDPSRASQCTAILTEGDSASQYAIILQGLIEDGNDKVGILPLQGKPPNVRKKISKGKHEEVLNNKEFKNIQAFFNLKPFTDYTEPKNFAELRYGNCVILADADDDGKHIDSLIFEMFYTLYPSLLEIGYVSILRTPIIRIKGRGHNIPFYTDAEYQLWLQQTPNPLTYGIPNYYKGLGSSTKQDVKDDFADSRYVEMVCDEQAGETLDLAFSDKRSDDRKKWIQEWNYTLEQLNIGHLERLDISEFLNKELVVYALRSIRRAIPALIDSLKDGQRKVLYAAMKEWGYKKKMPPSIKVNSLTGAVIKDLEYHHGDTSLNKTIIGMAQNFTGSNNMNYLYPDGLFGSASEGGADHASPRYIKTRLEWWFEYVYRQEDLPLLKLRLEEGKQIEPEFFLPILPMQLINGAHGIATGFSTDIPNYHPLAVSGALKCRLRNEPVPSLSPEWIGFDGEVKIGPRTHRKEEEILTKEERKALREDEGTPLSVITKGVYELKNRTVYVTTLPIKVWAKTYKKWLDGLIAEKQISGYDHIGNEEKPGFVIYGFRDPSYKNLGLIKSFGLTNMVLLDREGKPIRYPSVEALFETFYRERLPFYEERRRYSLGKMQEEITRLEAKTRYVEAVRDKKIEITGDKHKIEASLNELGIPLWVRAMKTSSIDVQNVEKIYDKITSLREKFDAYSKKTPEDLWYEDIEKFEAAWHKHVGTKKRLITTKKRSPRQQGQETKVVNVRKTRETRKK